MLYTLPAKKLEILTHPYTPLMEENGFRQAGKEIPGVLVIDSAPYLPLSTVRKIPFSSSNTAIRNTNARKISSIMTHNEVKNIGPKWKKPVPLKPVFRGEAPPYQSDDRDGYLLGSDSSRSGFPRSDSSRRVESPIGPSVYSDPFGVPVLNRDNPLEVKTEDGDKIDVESGYIPGLGSDLSGFRSSFKKFTRKIRRVVRQVRRKPLEQLAKLPTAPVRLITDPIGGKTARVAKKIQGVTVGAQAGALTGFVTGGFTPAGLVAGAAAGTAKGIVEMTKTSRPGDLSKTLRQSAAYGAGAGAVTGAARFGARAFAARGPATAKQANIAMFAGKSGYVPAAAQTSTKIGASVAKGATGLIGTAGKVAGGTAKALGKAALGPIGQIAVLQSLLSRGAGIPQDIIENLDPGGALPPGYWDLINNELRRVQANPGNYPSGYADYLQGLLGPGGVPWETDAPYATPESQLVAGESPWVKRLPLVALAGGAVLLFVTRKPAKARKSSYKARKANKAGRRRRK